MENTTACTSASPKKAHIWEPPLEFDDPSEKEYANRNLITFRKSLAFKLIESMKGHRSLKPPRDRMNKFAASSMSASLES
jgi:hypothetical protein